ncbi:MAG: SgcJ/EcaC family oxidoreductase [Candidatus Sulfotelmatobacter sp.]
MDRDKKLGKPSGVAPAQDPDDATPSVGPYNPALGEIYQRLYPEMRRPKPNQEAIAAALQAMQRLTMKMDSETAVEETTPETTAIPSAVCPSCGHHNRTGNKFCGMCGLPVDLAPKEASESLAHETPNSESAALELPDAAREFAQTLPPVPEVVPAHEVHAPAGSPAGAHHYHHHYHHHYFQGGVEGSFAAPPRANAPESAREADRMRIAAAAKGEPMSRSEAAVRRLTQEWVLACNTRQLDELLDLYAPDALVLRSNLPLLRGAAAVREFFFSALESGLGEVAVEPIRVEVIGDMAHEVGRYSALVPGTSGKRREERGKYLWVFAKQSSGDWKLVSECWSSDLTLTSAESDIPKAVPSAPKSQPRRS